MHSIHFDSQTEPPLSTPIQEKIPISICNHCKKLLRQRTVERIIFDRINPAGRNGFDIRFYWLTHWCYASHWSPPCKEYPASLGQKPTGSAGVQTDHRIFKYILDRTFGNQTLASNYFSAVPEKSAHPLPSNQPPHHGCDATTRRSTV